MARRYDSRTTTFSPEGRLYQVEYANEAINNTGTTLGVVCNDSVILAGEKKVISKLLDKGTASEKLYIIDDHVVVAVATSSSTSFDCLHSDSNSNTESPCL